MKNDRLRGKYRHFKGNEYELIDFARCSETEVPMVIYRSLSAEVSDLWVRPQEMFFETIKRDGKIQKRFEYIGNAKD